MTKCEDTCEGEWVKCSEPRTDAKGRLWEQGGGYRLFIPTVHAPDCPRA
jgi:hypothetical protein